MVRQILQYFKPSRRGRQVEMFHELLSGSKRVSTDEFAVDFGGIADDVVEMLSSSQVQTMIQEAREAMEAGSLRKVDFGKFDTATELEKGEVAAIDGTFALPMQKYSTGQAICVGIGSLSHRRPMQDSLHYWSSKVFLSDAADTEAFIERERRSLFGIYPTAYLRYYEVSHCLEVKEPYLFLDGPLVDESLIATQDGRERYTELFKSEKYQAIGVIKNIGNPVFTKFARALNPGEIYVVETLQDHLNQGSPARRFKIARDILRGVFKPRKKAFGFEVHRKHLDDMLRIMAADCQMNKPGHEIPFLLNRIDEEVRKNFDPRILKDRIAAQMAAESEELFFGETDERDFR
ncbi:MAG: hypothetical protein OXN27_18610 [Candidatus Poribacteria bacterium]|nr:hypothetical protein [Candidatus Poribacteria bacterium]